MTESTPPTSPPPPPPLPSPTTANQRDVVKANWLQQKICKKSGTLIRKKKIRYEEAEWVVLCVHDDRIPLLEWYYSEECANEHKPSKLLDLLDSAFVTPVISDQRSFIIGFSHSSYREPVELVALTDEDCTDWIQKTTSTLTRLRCLNDSTSNVYSPLPDNCSCYNDDSTIATIYPDSGVVSEHPFNFNEVNNLLDSEISVFSSSQPQPSSSTIHPNHQLSAKSRPPLPWPSSTSKNDFDNKIPASFSCSPYEHFSSTIDSLSFNNSKAYRHAPSAYCSVDDAHNDDTQNDDSREAVTMNDALLLSTTNGVVAENSVKCQRVRKLSTKDVPPPLPPRCDHPKPSSTSLQTNSSSATTNRSNSPLKLDVSNLNNNSKSPPLSPATHVRLSASSSRIRATSVAASGDLSSRPSSTAGSVYDFPKNCISSPKGIYGVIESPTRPPVHRSNQLVSSCISSSPQSRGSSYRRSSEYGKITSSPSPTASPIIIKTPLRVEHVESTSPASSLLSKEVPMPSDEERLLQTVTKSSDEQSSSQKLMKRGYSVPSSVPIPFFSDVSAVADSTSTQRNAPSSAFIRNHHHSLDCSTPTTNNYDLPQTFLLSSMNQSHNNSNDNNYINNITSPTSSSTSQCTNNDSFHSTTAASDMMMMITKNSMTSPLVCSKRSTASNSNAQSATTNSNSVRNSSKSPEYRLSSVAPSMPPATRAPPPPIPSMSPSVNRKSLGTGTPDTRCSIYGTPTDVANQNVNKNLNSAADFIQQRQQQPRQIALQLALCVESIAFVEINGRIWIGGWSTSSDKHLTGVLNIGDEVLKVGTTPVQQLTQLPALFYSTSIPGTPVNLLMNQIPYGMQYTFMKTSRNYDLGIILRKHKNKVEGIREGSPAEKAGLRVHICGMSGQLTQACITSVDGHSLNLFARNDEVLKRIDAIRPLSKFILIIQPYDFIKELKRAVKKLKNFSHSMRVSTD